MILPPPKKKTGRGLTDRKQKGGEKVQSQKEVGRQK